MYDALYKMCCLCLTLCRMCCVCLYDIYIYIYIYIYMCVCVCVREKENVFLQCYTLTCCVFDEL